MYLAVSNIHRITGEYPELLNFKNIMVTTSGVFYDKNEKRVLTTHIDSFGYEKVTIGKKQYYVHRLVASLFVKKYSSKHKIVCHKNKNRSDNRSINLMWTNNNFINIRRIDFRSPNKGKKIDAYKDGKFIRTFDNGGHAQRVLKIKNRSEIYRCCKGTRLSTNGYTFKYHKN